MHPNSWNAPYIMPSPFDVERPISENIYCVFNSILTCIRLLIYIIVSYHKDEDILKVATPGEYVQHRNVFLGGEASRLH